MSFRISLQSSGGRGEYEIAGSAFKMNHSDLLDRRIQFEVSFGSHRGIISSSGRLTRKEGQGKWRIRLFSGEDGIHPSRLVAAFYALPKPRRESTPTPTPASGFQSDEYFLDHVHFDVRSITAASFVAEIKGIEGRFRNGTRFDLQSGDLAVRSQAIGIVLDHLATLPGGGGRWLTFRSALLAGIGSPSFPDQKGLEQLVAGLWSDGGDPLAGIERLVPAGSEAAEEEAEQPIPGLTAADVPAPTDPIEIKRRKVVLFRKTATRTGSAKKFARDVKAAYDNTCAVCGVRLPKTTVTSMPGVDAAHILAWSDYELDVVPNGICLCKYHHWAFDQLLFTFVRSPAGLKIKTTKALADARREDGQFAQDIAALNGASPKKLPDSATLHPAEEVLQRYNAMLG